MRKKSYGNLVIWLVIVVIILVTTGFLLFLSKKDAICNSDNDCAVNTCACRVQTKNSIKEEDQICAVFCGIKPVCLNNICQSVKLVQPSMPATSSDINPKDVQFICPDKEYIDCMPKIVNENTPEVNQIVDKNCNQEFLSWAEKNCPNFKGAAY